VNPRGPSPLALRFLAGDRVGVRVATVGELEIGCAPILRHYGFGGGDRLPVLLVDLLNGSIIHHFDN